MQTAEIFASVLKFPRKKIENTDSLLPGSEPHLFYKELAKHRHLDCAFCFGHAPHLDQLLAVALGARRSVSELKKAGVALLDLAHISPPEAILIWLGTPKLLKKAGK